MRIEYQVTVRLIVVAQIVNARALHAVTVISD